MNTDEICELLKKELPEVETVKNESMKKHTSFKIGGNAEVFVKAKEVNQIEKIQKICKKNNIPLTIIGNGSNILVNDEGIKGIVLKICIDYCNIEYLNEEQIAIVTVGSGVLLGKLAYELLNKSITGFEFAAGIPGTIGGAVRMNAGAYGTEFKDIVIETTALDKNGNIVILKNEDQQFEYRNSIFKNKEYIILSTKMKLKKIENQNEIKEKMDEFKSMRMEKQPLEYPSAGSTFKRGNDFITAKLIDECGLKGYKVGGAQVSTKHAGFIVNVDNATAKDVLQLVKIVKEKVFEKFEKNIELEIELI